MFSHFSSWLAVDIRLFHCGHKSLARFLLLVHNYELISRHNHLHISVHFVEKRALRVVEKVAQNATSLVVESKQLEQRKRQSAKASVVYEQSLEQSAFEQWPQVKSQQLLQQGLECALERAFKTVASQAARNIQLALQLFNE